MALTDEENRKRVRKIIGYTLLSLVSAPYGAIYGARLEDNHEPILGFLLGGVLTPVLVFSFFRLFFWPKSE